MSCNCAETNFMDGKGHDNGCPIKITQSQSVLVLKPKCHKTIQLDKIGHKVTYCMLPLNHEGKCA